MGNFISTASLDNSLTYVSTSAVVLEEAGKLLVNIRRIVERSCPADVLHVLPSVKKKHPVPRRQFTSPELPPRKRRRTKVRQTSAVGDEDMETGSAAANTAVDDVAITAEATTEAGGGHLCRLMQPSTLSRLVRQQRSSKAPSQQPVANRKRRR